MLVLRILLALIAAAAVAGAIYFASHPVSGTVPLIGAVAAVFGFLVLGLYFVARFIVWWYVRRRARPRGFAVKDPHAPPGP